MKQRTRLLSALLFALLPALSLVFAVACDGNGTSQTVTTQGVTTQGTTDTEAVTEPPTVTLTAADVDAMIAAIDGATLENEAKIDEAYLAYCSLSEEERAKVTVFETLQSYRYELTKAYVVKTYSDTRIPHNELLLGAYVCNQTGSNITTDAHLQDMVDCHIDFAWQVCNYLGKEPLALYAKYGIGVFEWVGNLGIPLAPGHSIEELRAMTAGQNYDAESLWAFYQVDEPTLDAIPVWWRNGKVMKEELLPNCAYNMTLLPNYAMIMNTYADYVKAFVETVENDFIVYDHYLYGDNGYMYDVDESGENYVVSNPLAAMLDNLDVVSRYGREYDRDLYLILQSFSTTEQSTLSTDQLKFQAYSAMAYGAKSISWACWIRGWGENNVLDEVGNKTEMYDKVKETNADLKALEPIYMRYTNTAAAALTGVQAPIGAKSRLELYHGNTDASLLTQGALSQLSAGDKSAVLVGQFEKNVGEGEAFLFVGMNNYLFPKEQLATATFKTADPNAVVTAYVKGVATRLQPDESGVYTVEIHTADAVFVTVD